MANMLELNRENVINYIKNMSVIELSQFIKELEEALGVQAQAGIMASMIPGAQGAVSSVESGPKEEEQTEFSVILVSYLENKKIPVMKVVKDVTGLGLKEAKDLVDNVPKPVKEGISKKDAEALVKKIEEAGGKAEIK